VSRERTELPRFYTPEQVAAVIQRSPSHVRGLIRGGVLVAVNVARATKPRKEGEKAPRPLWIVPHGELVAFLVARGLVASDAIVSTDATDATVEAAASAQRVSGSKT